MRPTKRRVVTLLVGAGLVAFVSACASHHGGMEADEEAGEVKVAWADVPIAVQTTLQHQAGGKTIKTVDRETVKGQTVYEADVLLDGKNWEIVVAQDGTLVSRKLDDESAEKDGKH